MDDISVVLEQIDLLNGRDITDTDSLQLGFQTLVIHLVADNDSLLSTDGTLTTDTASAGSLLQLLELIRIKRHVWLLL